ncbi:hypothetical protein ILYODFUR_022796 [Ilyodon furcidens]|uniref:JAB1/MPN/MOV34 metalloenzyme domain-containing protein n=1 Tax=Ilyodon furcidens TaxID=33524 RepID=A0ABV0UUG4_9TELE
MQASEEISACWFIREAIRRSSIRGLFQRHVVVLKIIKHYQEEGQGSEVVQGVLLGLVVDDRLEITNCFPFPQHTEDDADFDEVFAGKHVSVCMRVRKCANATDSPTGASVEPCSQGSR